MTDLLISTLTQGLIYALISFGVYITYSILDFPDLGVDGTFPLGAAVTAVLLTRGVDPWLTLVAAVAVGALAGLFTGVVHVCLRVRNLLAGIITMTALFSINLQIAGSNLTVDRGTETVLASDTTLSYSGATAAPDDYTRSTETVVLSGSDGGVVVTQEVWPRYRGALVVCEGGGDPAVQLSVVQAVGALTGLGSDKISVVKWQA